MSSTVGAAVRGQPYAAAPPSPSPCRPRSSHPGPRLPGPDATIGGGLAGTLAGAGKGAAAVL